MTIAQRPSPPGDASPLPVKGGTLVQPAHPEVSDYLSQPPALVARGLVWVLTALFVASLAWSALSRVDVVVTARGVLRPQQPATEVMTTVPARILEVRVHEGDRVRKGQVLLVLDSRTTAGEVATVTRARESLARARQEQRRDLPLKVGRLLDERGGLERRLESVETLLAQIESQRSRVVSDFALQISSQELELRKARQSLSQVRLDMQQDQRSVALVQDLLETHKRLAAKGLVSRIQLLDLEHRLQEARTQWEKRKASEKQSLEVVGQQEQSLRRLSVAQQTSQNELNRRSEELRSEEKSARSRLAQLEKEADLASSEASSRVAQAETALKEARAAAAPGLSEKGSMEGFELETSSGNLLVKSTIEATVASLQARTAGLVVTPGQLLLRLLPTDSPLILEANFANRDIGRIRPDLAAKIRLDAFPFQKYGIVPGRVVRVSPDAEQDPKLGYTYRVECSLDRTSVRGEGREAALFPGLTAEVQVVTRQESVLQLLIRPFRELGEGLSVQD